MIAAADSSGGAAGLLVVFLVLWIGLWLVLPMFVGKRIGSNKGRTNGLWYGFWLGWLGVIILACRSTLNQVSPKEQELADLETEVRLAELRARQTAIAQEMTPSV